MDPEKCDETAASMIAQLKFGSAMPFADWSGWRSSWVPLPAATQWEFVEEAAELSPYQVFGLADAIEFGSASWSIFTLSPTLCPAVSITKRSRFHVS